jgi:Lrp/AsnC family leucine-responsive transcriptional regulator
MPMDDVSLSILKILQEKARIPNVDVARQIGMAPSAVLERIRKLEKQGYIDGYEVRLNPQRFRRSLVCFIHVFVAPKVNHQDIASQLSALEAAQEVHFITGEDSYLVKARVAGPKELNDLIQNQIGTFAGVRATRSFIVTATMKETARIPINELDIDR